MPPAPAERRVILPRQISPQTLAGAGRPHHVHHLGGETMGTEWTAAVALPAALRPSAAEEALLRVFDQIIDQRSPWNPLSAISQFNRAPAGEWQTLPAEFFAVLQQALQVAMETRGAYNPMLGKAMDLLGFGPGSAGSDTRAADTLQAALDTSAGLQLELETTTNRARQPGNLHLDLSSIAKGYAVDLGAKALLALGCANFLIEIGGEVRAQGCKPDGQPWWCRLQYPDTGCSKEVPETMLALCDRSLASSGNTLRQRQIAGQWYGHILHGIRGPLQPSSLETVFVLHPECVTADAYATALFALGGDEGADFARNHHLAALFVHRTETGFSETPTPAWEALMD